jgi:peptidoglycan hydrolase-like protein with peptidoglycan-binding domain
MGEFEKNLLQRRLPSRRAFQDRSPRTASRSASTFDYSRMRLFLCLLVAAFGAVNSVRANETVRAVQTRLKAGGFYFGKINGDYNSDTAAAVTRYQIRNGLQITGKLDSQTSYALGVSETKPSVPTPAFGEDVWRYLRKSDQKHIQRMIAEEERPKQSGTSPPPKPASTVPATIASTPGVRTPNPAPAAPSSPAFTRERLSDYIAAFVLAGLDPQVGAETEFFAERVNYFGKPGVDREAIQHDLQRYNARWPQRSFSLAGELEISSVNQNLKVAFPLRYDLRNGPKRASGKVLKTLVLEKTGADDLQIVSVDERKL